MLDNDEVPQSWKDPQLMAQPVVLETRVYRALAFHGAMVLATKRPEVGTEARKIVEDMLDHLEAMFEDLGVEQPAHGWRGQLLQEGTGYE